jgi:hypothetical protein
MPILGSCGSDDSFFSLETSDLPYNPNNPEHVAAIESGEGRTDHEKKRIYIRRQIPASEVTRENIYKSALTNLFVNGVTRVLGLRKMTAESLKEYGIDPDKVPSFEYGSKTKESGRLAPAVEEKREAIWKMLLEMNENDAEKAANSLKGWTAFKDFQGQSDHKRLSEPQIAKLKRLRSERNEADVTTALTALTDGARGGGNLLDLAVKAARAKATVGEKPKPYPAFVGAFRSNHEFQFADIQATETWKDGLPKEVAAQCQWWAEHLKEVPIGVKETPAYDPSADVLTVRGKVEFLKLGEGVPQFGCIKNGEWLHGACALGANGGGEEGLAGHRGRAHAARRAGRRRIARAPRRGGGAPAAEPHDCAVG